MSLINNINTLEVSLQKIKSDINNLKENPLDLDNVDFDDLNNTIKTLMVAAKKLKDLEMAISVLSKFCKEEGFKYQASLQTNLGFEDTLEYHDVDGGVVELGFEKISKTEIHKEAIYTATGRVVSVSTTGGKYDGLYTANGSLKRNAVLNSEFGSDPNFVTKSVVEQGFLNFDYSNQKKKGGN